MVTQMRVLGSVLVLLATSPALAAHLTYNCEGLWGTPIIILKTTAVIEGEFSPAGIDSNAQFKLENGAVLKGHFSGSSGPYQASGSLDGATEAIHYDGSLSRTATVDKRGGFTFISGNVTALLQCRLK